ncbi:MAG: hypothetical protein VYA17_04795, partial [Pseudomonadota bacterium]|nr:hypothetical protein [Pseudomonadota bacterium]
IRCAGKHILLLLVGVSLSSCFATKPKTEYVLSGADRHGCAMFQPAGEGIFIAVVIWKTRGGRYTAGYPGKDDCEKAIIPKRGPKPILRKTN